MIEDKRGFVKVFFSRIGKAGGQQARESALLGRVWDM
jgi:hypothetical protein